MTDSRWRRERATASDTPATLRPISIAATVSTPKPTMPPTKWAPRITAMPPMIAIWIASATTS
jgi:hypothetical protein